MKLVPEKIYITRLSQMLDVEDTGIEKVIKCGSKFCSTHPLNIAGTYNSVPLKLVI